MVDDRFLRRARVAIPDGVEDLPVVPVGGEEDPVDQTVDRHPHRRSGILDRPAHQVVPGGVGDGQVEGVVGCTESLGFAVLVHDVISLVQDGQILVGAPACRQACGGALHRDAVVEEFLDLRKSFCQQRADALLVLGLVKNDDAAA